MALKTSKAGIELICKFEGFSAKPYKCPANVWTIGYGSTFLADGSEVCASTPSLTKEAAMELFGQTLKAYEVGVRSCVKVPLTQSQFDALVSFSYNVGPAKLVTSTLLKKLNAGDYQGAADQFLVWTKAGGKDLPGLILRRNAERTMFLS